MSVTRRPASCVGRPARSALAATAALLLLAATLSPAQSTGTAVEYSHAGFDHYFMTASASDIALLDGGAFGGVWRRTGQSFPVWTQPGSGTSETCRFFSAAYAPKSSHFCTPLASECSLRKQDPHWTYETVAFQLRTDPLGNCDAGTSALYRLFNDMRSGAPNRRCTTSRATFDLMLAQGWMAEGAGPMTVFACVPASDTTLERPSGYWQGTSSAGEEIAGVMLDDGAFWFFYASPERMGIIDGRAAFDGRSFSAPAAREFEVLPNPHEHAASVSGTFVPGQALSGHATSLNGGLRFTATYVGPSEPVSLAQVSGHYDGVAATGHGYVEAAAALQASGAFELLVPGCAGRGGFSTRGDAGIAEVSMDLGGSSCALGSARTRGFAVFDGPSGALVVLTRSDDGEDLFTFVGIR